MKTDTKEQELDLGTQTISQAFYDLEQHANQEILDDLSAVGDTLEQMAWKAGWLVEKLYHNLLANDFQVNGRVVDYLFICHYVSIVRLRGQRKANTLKKWGLVARFFPEKIAKKFHNDVLPFSHFVLAASYDDLVHPSGEKMWRVVLNKSWESYCSAPMSRHISEQDLKDWAEGRTPKQRTAKSVTTVPTMTPMSGYTASDEEEFTSPAMPETPASADPGVIVGILGGIAQNFVLGAQAYVPVLAQSRPHLAHGLAKLLQEAQDFVAALNNPEE